MMEQQNIQSAKGVSGIQYEFELYDFPPHFKKHIGAVYIISKDTNDGNHKPIYIGITEDISERFDNHHKMDRILKYDPTHIGIYFESNEQKRLEIETDLIKGLKPPCNG